MVRFQYTNRQNSCSADVITKACYAYIFVIFFERLIFKILPQAKRIFLFTRPTDSAALQSYAAMGFKRDENPFQDPKHKINHQYMTSLDYRVEESETLQKIANTMDEKPKELISRGL